jgi:hypothetical protein
VSECVLNATEILDLGRVNVVKALVVLGRPFKDKDNNTLTIVKQAIKECVADIAEKQYTWHWRLGPIHRQLTSGSVIHEVVFSPLVSMDECFR